MRVLAFLFSFLVLCAVAIGGTALYIWHKPLSGPSAELFYIESGTSTRAIAEQLFEAEIINETEKLFFLAGLRLSKTSLRAGEYEIPPQSNLRGMAELFHRGKTYQRFLTLPEGRTSAEVVEILNNNSFLSGEIESLPSEGQLLPETYSFSRGDRREDILQRMSAAMDKALESLWAERAEGLPYETPEEVLIMASIIEKETGQPEERARVAGVFVNRLRRGMRLQSDPTVIYALTQGLAPLGRALTRADWATESPYNTYQNTGLPPGPIANPGRDSLRAALHPEDHDYLYFVADGTGGHAFARTLEDHNRNVARWRQIRDAVSVP